MAETQRSNLGERIEQVCRGLVYISETDSEVEPFRGLRSESTDQDAFRKSAAVPSGTVVERGDLDAFIERLSQIRNWHSVHDKQNAKGFDKLFELLKKNLSDLRLYRVGRIQVVLYVVGIDKKGRMRGVKMRAVET